MKENGEFTNMEHEKGPPENLPVAGAAPAEMEMRREESPAGERGLEWEFIKWRTGFRQAVEQMYNKAHEVFGHEESQERTRGMNEAFQNIYWKLDDIENALALKPPAIQQAEARAVEAQDVFLTYLENLLAGEPSQPLQNFMEVAQPDKLLAYFESLDAIFKDGGAATEGAFGAGTKAATPEAEPQAAERREDISEPLRKWKLECSFALSDAAGMLADVEREFNKDTSDLAAAEARLEAAKDRWYGFVDRFDELPEGELKNAIGDYMNGDESGMKDVLEIFSALEELLEQKKSVSAARTAAPANVLAAHTAAAKEREAGAAAETEEVTPSIEKTSAEATETTKETGTDAAVVTMASENHPERNEDSVLFLKEKGLFGVFDGMGGHEKGDIASQMAWDAVQERAQGMSQAASEEEAKRMISEMLAEANERVLRAGQESLSSKKMATTASLVYLWEGASGERKAIVGNVGDSRVYVLRANGGFEQITLDDSFVRAFFPDEQKAREAQGRLNNALGESELANDDERSCFRQRNKILQAIGNAHIEPRIYAVDVQPGDKVLVLSDGISDNLTDNEMRDILQNASGSDAASRALAEAAQSRSNEHLPDGSRHPRAKHDDMSAIAIEVPGKRSEGEEAPAAEAAKGTAPEGADASAAEDIARWENEGGAMEAAGDAVAAAEALRKPEGSQAEAVAGAKEAIAEAQAASPEMARAVGTAKKEAERVMKGGEEKKDSAWKKFKGWLGEKKSSFAKKWNEAKKEGGATGALKGGKFWKFIGTLFVGLFFVIIGGAYKMLDSVDKRRR